MISLSQSGSYFLVKQVASRQHGEGEEGRVGYLGDARSVARIRHQDQNRNLQMSRNKKSFLCSTAVVCTVVQSRFRWLVARMVGTVAYWA